ncbi:MAG: ABC transporter permease [bacterium]|nr:ABC transporter permease [bacterium]
MRQLFYLLQKEFWQFRKDPAMMRVILVVPIVQMLILSYAANTDLKEMRMIVIDYDRTIESRKLVETFYSSNYFKPAEETANSFSAATRELDHGNTDVILTIPSGYSRAITNSKAQLGLTVDGTNSNIAGLGSGYAAQIIAETNKKLMQERKDKGLLPDGMDVAIQPVVRIWFNPETNVKMFMVPGILVMLITTISGMLSGVAIVKEKEIGTIELLLVAPLSRWQIIAGKLIPFFILSFVVMGIGLTVGMLWFKVPFAGSVLTLIVGSSLYLGVTLAVGLFVSTFSSTQMQAMFSVWFFLIFGILTSGFFFPVENMPEWLQKLTLLNPMRYMMEIVRSVLLKGATFHHLTFQLLALGALAITTFSFAVARFKQQLD